MASKPVPAEPSCHEVIFSASSWRRKNRRATAWSRYARSNI